MRRALAFALVLSLTAGCAAAPTDPAGPEATPVTGEQGRCVAGVVTDAELTPLPNASVAAGAGGAQTGDDGRFELCGLSDGDHEANVTKAGYVPASRNFTVPSDGRLAVALTRVPADDRRIETLPFTLHYTFGYATWDATLGRQGVNASTCEPCTFEFAVAELPDIVYLEADWTRSFMPPEGARDLMFHVFRAGAPFDEGTDLGSGAKEKPFAFNYPRHEIEKNGAAHDADGTYRFSGLVACDGNAPCVDQRIDVWASLLYDYERVPAGYSAVAAPP